MDFVKNFQGDLLLTDRPFFLSYHNNLNMLSLNPGPYKYVFSLFICSC